MLQYLTALFVLAYFDFDGETALAACVLRRQLKKGCQLF